MLLRLACLNGGEHVPGPAPSPASDHEKDTEILVLRHQIAFIRDRDGKFPELFDAVLADAGIKVVLTGVRTPRMNALMERWVQTCRRELFDRTLIWNQSHLLRTLREFEVFYNSHRPRQGIANARPLLPLPPPITDPDQIANLDIRRRQRLGGIINAYEHAA